MSLRLPLRVVLADIYHDGVAWFSIEDPSGQRATVCIDGRNSSPTRFRLFEMARHPSDPNALILALGSEEEGIVVPLVSTWLDSGNHSDLGLTEYGCERLREAVIRIGDGPEDTL